MNRLDKLTRELKEWQEAHGYTVQCAAELKCRLACDVAWLNDFCDRWETAENEKTIYLSHNEWDGARIVEFSGYRCESQCGGYWHIERGGELCAAWATGERVRRYMAECGQVVRWTFTDETSAAEYIRYLARVRLLYHFDECPRGIHWGERPNTTAREVAILAANHKRLCACCDVWQLIESRADLRELLGLSE